MKKKLIDCARTTKVKLEHREGEIKRMRKKITTTTESKKEKLNY